ncbi:MAG: Golgi apparatus membrane protein tvp18 [Thelocarpon superellum]|nr:MAG: Golgi apparatus membrane protein tvp18 [Thelocarpon superellum]
MVHVFDDTNDTNGSSEATINTLPLRKRNRGDEPRPSKMTILEEFQTRNFSIYGQWTGVLSIVICFAVGIANIFLFHLVILAFSILCICSGFIIIFIEIPLLLRICPTSSKFDALIRRVTTNYMRAAVYLVMSVIQWASASLKWTSLIAAATTLLFAAIFYALAGLRGQDFVGSKTLGGQGVAQMIV